MDTIGIKGNRAANHRPQNQKIMKKIVLNEELMNVINQVRKDMEGREIVNLSFEYEKTAPRIFVTCEATGETYLQHRQKLEYVYYRESKKMECVSWD